MHPFFNCRGILVRFIVGYITFSCNHRPQQKRFLEDSNGVDTPFSCIHRPQHKRSLSGSKVQLYIFCCSKSPVNIFRIINRDDLLLLYNVKGK